MSADDEEGGVTELADSTEASSPGTRRRGESLVDRLRVRRRRGTGKGAAVSHFVPKRPFPPGPDDGTGGCEGS